MTLSYTKFTQKTTIGWEPDTIFHIDMQHVLGFYDSNVTNSKDADSVVDMAQGFYSLYVYTNIVEPHLVGDSAVPLLRIVPLEGKHGDKVSKTFDNVQHVPVLHKEFGMREVDIRDDSGRSASFEVAK